ncbi:MAG TPA: competence/damage-inducible protein A [Moorella mulderi]|nr:competence/damage-inducible protein A [Moorella mulderi]
MRAEVIFTGTELLLGHLINTNGAFLARELADLGIELSRQVVVGDDLESIREAIREASLRADLIIIGGGLGPTEDDLSREALAQTLGLPLVENLEARENLESYSWRRGTKPSPRVYKQALLPRGAEALPNPVGAASGAYLEHEGKIYVLLPGPSQEFAAVVKEELLPRLNKLLQARGEKRAVITSRIIKVMGLPEAAVASALGELLQSCNPAVVTLVTKGEVHIKLTARASDHEEARRLFAPLEEIIHQRLKDHIFGYDQDTLEEAVGKLLREKGMTLATAESCTGGLLGHRITNVPGSSDYFLGGIVAYSNEVKIKFLGVPLELIQIYGAVSPQVAEAMAKGMREKFSAHVGIGITGIAGPTGGTEEKPVGLVYMGIDCQGKVQVEKRNFVGDRENIKWHASQYALYLLWRHLKS